MSEREKALLEAHTIHHYSFHQQNETSFISGPQYQSCLGFWRIFFQIINQNVRVDVGVPLYLSCECLGWHQTAISTSQWQIPLTSDAELLLYLYLRLDAVVWQISGDMYVVLVILNRQQIFCLNSHSVLLEIIIIVTSPIEARNFTFMLALSDGFKMKYDNYKLNFMDSCV